MSNTLDPRKQILNAFEHEASVILASVSDEKYNKYVIDINNSRNILEQMDITDTTSTFIDKLMDVIKFLKTDVYKHLTLLPNEFHNDSIDGIHFNKRFPSIYKKDFNSDVIYYKHAYLIQAIKFYNNTSKVCFDIENYPKKITNNKIYIEDAGYISEKYFKDCIIHPECIGLFTLQSKVILPVNRFIDNDNEILFINCKHPKLKILKEFYNVPILTDENMLDEKGYKKYNIRKFEKIK